MTKKEYNSEIRALWKAKYNFHEECILSIDIKEKYIDSLEKQLSNLNHNYEMQEIMIADYKKRIEELEAPIVWI